MAIENGPINPLPEKATITEIVAKLNTVIQRINAMWYPEEE